MNTTQSDRFSVYWANLCVLNRMERDKMDSSAEVWGKEKKLFPEMLYLGDTEEVQMYEQMETDIARGKLGFDCIVSSRFDLFCSPKYLQSFTDDLLPIADEFPIRDEVAASGVLDPLGLFYPLVVLPHFIVCNMDLIGTGEKPVSLADLLDPFWEGRVYMGSTELPSAKSFLFAMWYKFGNDGLETCVRNWRQLSAPSACRHGLMKDRFPVGLLPGIFTNPGPGEKLLPVWPAEGAPVLPSYTAVQKSKHDQDIIEFLRVSAASDEFVRFYTEKGLAYPSHPAVEPPEEYGGNTGFFFPAWEWILEQDMEYFEDACSRVPSG